MSTMRRLFGFIFFFVAIFVFGFLSMLSGFLPGLASSTVCIRSFSRLVLWVTGLKLEVKGQENLDLKGPVIIMANHTTIMDIAIVPAALPLHVRFMFKHTLAYIPIVGWGMVMTGMIPIKRGSKGPALKSLRKAASQIGRGTPIVVFPEGTRSHSGELGKLKKGGFLLASLAKATILPVRIQNADKLCHRNYPLIHPGTLNITIHPPIGPGSMGSRSELIEHVRQCLSNEPETE